MRSCLGTGSTSGTVLGHAARTDRGPDLVDTACAGVSKSLERRSRTRSEKCVRKSKLCTLDVGHTLQKLRKDMEAFISSEIYIPHMRRARQHRDEGIQGCETAAAKAGMNAALSRS
jgi:hypothetical protein